MTTRDKRIQERLEATQAVVKAARRVLNDITAQGNVEARVSSGTEIQLTNALLRLDAAKIAPTPPPPAYGTNEHDS